MTTCANCNARIVQIETGRWADVDRIDVDCTGLDCHGDYHEPGVELTTTDELLLRAAARLVHRPSVVLIDAVDRLDRLNQGDTTPWEEWGYPNSDSGWRSAIERAELELEEVLREQVSAA